MPRVRRRRQRAGAAAAPGAAAARSSVRAQRRRPRRSVERRRAPQRPVSAAGRAPGRRTAGARAGRAESAREQRRAGAVRRRRRSSAGRGRRGRRARRSSSCGTQRRAGRRTARRPPPAAGGARRRAPAPAFSPRVRLVGRPRRAPRSRHDARPRRVVGDHDQPARPRAATRRPRRCRPAGRAPARRAPARRGRAVSGRSRVLATASRLAGTTTDQLRTAPCEHTRAATPVRSRAAAGVDHGQDHSGAPGGRPGVAPREGARGGAAARPRGVAHPRPPSARACALCIVVDLPARLADVPAAVPARRPDPGPRPGAPRGQPRLGRSTRSPCGRLVFDAGRIPHFLAKESLFKGVRSARCCAAPGRSRCAAVLRRRARRRWTAAQADLRRGQPGRDLPGGLGHPRPGLLADAGQAPASPGWPLTTDAVVVPVAQWGPQTAARLPPQEAAACACGRRPTTWSASRSTSPRCAREVRAGAPADRRAAARDDRPDHVPRCATSSPSCAASRRRPTFHPRPRRELPGDAAGARHDPGRRARAPAPGGRRSPRCSPTPAAT